LGTKLREVGMENASHYRALTSLYRQQAAYNPARKWHLLGQAERWEHHAARELASHFEETNQAPNPQAILSRKPNTRSILEQAAYGRFGGATKARTGSYRKNRGFCSQFGAGGSHETARGRHSSARSWAAYTNMPTPRPACPRRPV
jgi:hypothetical protein